MSAGLEIKDTHGYLSLMTVSFVNIVISAATKTSFSQRNYLPRSVALP
jgi:hypothetical protein